MRSVDWSRTPVGPAERWPSSLKTVLGLLLSSESPLCILWGPELVQFYNDGFRPILGSTKHPRALGQRARECWTEVWNIIEPMYAKVLAGGSTLIREGLLVLDRHGFLEECYFDYSYSALRDDASQISGILAICTEVTQRVLGERRLRVLGQLGVRSLEMKTPELACQAAALVLAEAQADLPFALMYLLDDDGTQARLTGCTGVELGHAAAPLVIRISEDDAAWPLDATRSVERELQLDAPFAASLPGGPWPESPRCATVLPIKRGGDAQPHGFLVAGISPRLELDDAYRDFLRLIASQLAAAIQQAVSFEHEKRRAETLAQLDRAKTTFFNNVSHEFRTPLTLMIGPLGDMLAEHPGDARLEMAHRNSLRLLKLVNTLLDFSRIEAGRIEASYELTDLSLLTAELASNFRSAIERAGMKLSVECEALPEPVYVDREMWEKIVLNLLSNAFKFTFEGGIGVLLRAVGRAAELEVRDSGTGIPADELPKIFERFHRIKGAHGRSYEGSGIGLALVQELARLHGGAVSVRSEVDHGSAFTVSIPLGKAHLPAERIAAVRRLNSTGVRAEVFVQEALRWLPAASAEPSGGDTRRPPRVARGQRILVADDNADLRDYVRSLLEVDYDVEVVEDGVAALEAARARTPHLIISDVMMPKLDGFGLISEVRAVPALATVPVMVLSARAGEEARLEGLSRGADDYLVKPFSARDLLASVAATLKSAGMRQRALEQERRFRTFVQASSDIVYSMSPDWREMRHLEGRDFIADTNEPNSSWLEKYIHADDQERVLAAIQDAIGGMKTFELEHRVWRVDGSLGWTFSRAIPIVDSEGAVLEWLGAASDITARKEAEQALREADRRKDEFLATLSHELRNPLAPLRNGLELMRLQGFRPNPTVQDVMERQLNHLVRLVDDLLEMSRITRGLLELRRERVELATIVRNAIETSHPLVQAARHRLDVSLPGEALWLDGDPVRLTQVVGNLLNNSAKYTDDGGTIVLSAWREQDFAVLNVRDNGCGITAAGIERIFDMFNREHHVTQRPQGGLGIGLTLSRRLVEMHGGTIEARSEGEDRGSEFIVRLPLARHSASAAGASPPVVRLPALRILVVDDNQDAASTLGALLEALGAEVAVVNDGPSAIETFAVKNQTVILLDIGMPGMDGYEVATALRSRFPEHRPTIIALSGWGQLEDRRKAQEAGIDHYLVKPLQFNLLRDILRTVAR